MAKQISSTEWDAEVIQSTVPVLVDVFGTYCGPCHSLAPTVNKLATEYEGRARVVKLDVEADRDLVAGLHVTSVPTVIAFRDGKETGRLVGLRPEGAYRQLLAEAGTHKAAQVVSVLDGVREPPIPASDPIGPARSRPGRAAAGRGRRLAALQRVSRTRARAQSSDHQPPTRRRYGIREVRPIPGARSFAKN